MGEVERSPDRRRGMAEKVDTTAAADEIPPELLEIIGDVPDIPGAGTGAALLNADPSLFSELTEEEAAEWIREIYARRRARSGRRRGRSRVSARH
jgi:hypothetical protein